MIDESLFELKRYFSNSSGNNQMTMFRGLEVMDTSDLCPIEVFYSSTENKMTPNAAVGGGSASYSSGPAAGHFKYAKADDEHFLRSLVEEAQARNLRRDAQELEAIKRRQYLKDMINNDLVTSVEMEPLGRFLHSSLREDVTAAKIRQDHEMDEADAAKKVPYISPAFFSDALYPTSVGINKRKFVMGMVESGAIRPAAEDYEDNNNIPWSMSDTFKWITQTVFKGPKWYMYEDNLQRLLLHAASRMKETMRLNPRGGTTVHVILFSPYDDPTVDVVNTGVCAEEEDKEEEEQKEEDNYEPSAKKLKRERTGRVMTTTLRGLLANINNGGIYTGFTIATLKQPFVVSEMSCGGDLRVFCDRLLMASFYAVFLTYLKLRVWVPQRLPESYFVTNTRHTTIKLGSTREVIHDWKSGAWIYPNHKRQLVHTNNFWTLVRHMLSRCREV